MDAAYDAPKARHLEAEIDAAYEAYDCLPLDEPDDWGDLASFHDASRLHRQELGATDGADQERRTGG